ncbi:MAG: hypothetical protein P4M08_08340 [Oligoflexia bacterium]|nr:hypothetical protein [Oligoflexia bacterium]
MRKLIQYRGALAYFAGYSIWIAAFKLVSLTFITYFVLASGGAAKIHAAHFEDVNDAFGSAEIPILALCALSFVLLQRLLNPLRKADQKPVFTPERFEKRFLPGFLHGSVLASGVLLAFLISGIYHYLGFFVHFEQAAVAFSSILLRTASVGVFAYCEEYIFRDKILGDLLKVGRETPRAPLPGPEKKRLQALVQTQNRELLAVFATSVLYVAVKFLQFDSELGWMNGITLFLVSLYLGVRMLFERDFAPGAGFWAAVLAVFHPLMSLPVFGCDFAGLILIKYEQLTSGINMTVAETTRFFSGGIGGPLASFAFQILMTFDMIRNVLRYKRETAQCKVQTPQSA